MKAEFISNIDPIYYDRIVYPKIVMGYLTAQHTLDGDALIYPNPEKYPLEPVETIPNLPPQYPEITLSEGVQVYLHPFIK